MKNLILHKKRVSFPFRIALLMTIPILLWQMAPHVDAWLISQASQEIDGSLKNLARVRKTTVYILDQQKWTEFSLLPKYKLIKVLSNVTVPQALSLNSELEWRYVLQYQLLDKEGNILDQGNYHHRTKATVYQDNNELLRPVFYLSSEQPTDGRYMFIHLLQNAAVLRVRLQSADPDVVDVAIRVHWRNKMAEDKLDYMWHRLNEKKKKAFARASVYEHEWFSKQEKRNLLWERWSVIGPLGVAGSEYYPRPLYIRRDREFERETIPPTIQAYGVFVDAQHWLTLPVEGGLVRLSFSEVEQSPVTIKIKWHGRQSTDSSELSFIWDGSKNGFEHEFAAGLLEISASQPVIMRAQTLEEETTPAPVHSSTVLIQGDMGVAFQINHPNQQAIPMRVNIRRLLENGVAETPHVAQGIPADLKLACNNVTYTLLDAEGHVQYTGTMPLTQSRSFYDRMTGIWWGQFKVSEPDSYYLSIPAKIATLRLESPCAVLVSAYNRPAGMLLKKRIPEDYYYTQDDKRERIPAWFRLRPKDYETLYQQNRTPLLRIQRRPPRSEPEKIEILLGKYLWEGFKPEGKYRSRYLLTKRESQLPLRNQALGTHYQPIPKNRPITLQFLNPRKTIQPTLIYRRSDKSPAQIRILLDNKLYYKGYIIGKHGEIKLPKLTTRTHTLIVKGEGQFFINHATPKDRQAIYVKRLAHVFGSKGQRFTYQKRSHDKELLSVRVYMPQGMQAPLQIRVKMTAAPKIDMQTYTGWTFRQRLYELHPVAGEEPVVVLNTRDNVVDAGQFFAIPLHEDLPPGKYQIELIPQKSVGAYLTLTKMTVGLQEELRQFFRETQTMPF
ncbi:MAG: hypothetical protein ABFS56_10715 [Pseudomonadota bacterium]